MVVKLVIAIVQGGLQNHEVQEASYYGSRTLLLAVGVVNIKIGESAGKLLLKCLSQITQLVGNNKI